ncbi:MAG: nucleotide sugar dehydrogenase [Nitrososphaerales archaeon]
MLSQSENTLLSKSEPELQETKASDLHICVVGLGFVGSAIAATFLRAGATVLGFDKSVDRVNKLKLQEAISEEKIRDAFRLGLNSGRLALITKDSDSLIRPDIKFICVPVYLRNDKTADLSFLESACHNVAKNLKKGDTTIICPSVPPGTTRRVLKPILEGTSGLVAGGDFNLVYSPERILVGRAVEDIENRYPIVISGIDEYSVAKAEWIFSKVAQKGVIKLPSLEAAELEKLAEGVYRDVNIALANELAMVCDDIGIDFWSVQRAANSQPFCKIHDPGFGVGGACIPIYPWFVANSTHKTYTRLIRDSRSINDSMVVLLVDSLKTKFQLKSGTKVAVLGLAFRGDVADARLSVTYRLVEKLHSNKFKVVVHDPIIENDLALGSILTNDLDIALLESDIAILVTDHTAYTNINWAKVASMRRGKLLLVDGKGIFAGRQINGIDIYGLGYGNNGLTLSER